MEYEEEGGTVAVVVVEEEYWEKSDGLGLRYKIWLKSRRERGGEIILLRGCFVLLTSI